MFSTLDCNAGYWQLPVAEEDKHLTAFTCHSSAWQCVRLPFGLCNAFATFQRAMDMILAGVTWQICLVYLDDVIVFSGSPEEHLKHLNEVAQAKDAFCQARLKELDALSPPDPTWSRQAFFFREKNGLLCLRSVYGRETQVVTPEALKKRLLTHQHQSVLAGHPGSRKMYNTLRRYVYWPTMVVDVYKHVEQCPACAKNRLSERKHTTVMKLFAADEPFSGLAMDLLGPLPTSKGGHKHVPVICDRFTELTRAVPLREGTALTKESAFMDTWVAAFGIPDTVLTDDGPQFASVYYQGILGLLGIASNYTSSYHSQTNGQVERYNRTLVRQLRCHVAEHQAEWDSHLSLLKTAYNTQVHSSTGETPFAFVSPRRLQLIGIERVPRLVSAEESSQSQ